MPRVKAYLARMARLEPDSLLAALATGFFALLVTLYFPSQIAAGNRAELTGNYLAPAAVSLAMSIGAAILVWLGVTALPALAARLAAIVLTGAAIAAFALGAFITPYTVDAGVIDGATTQVEFHPFIAIADAAAIAALFAGLAMFHNRLRGPLVTILPVMMLMVTAYSAYLLIAHGPGPAIHAEGEEEVERFYSLHPEENIILILLDEFDSEFMTVLLEEDPSLHDLFEGFTFFRDTAGVTTSTAGAMPAIHAGRMLMGDRHLAASYRSHVLEGSFLSEVARNGGDSALVPPMQQICPEGVTCLRRDFLEPDARGLSGEWRVLTEIALFRVAPHALKPSLFRGASWYVTSQGVEDDILILHEFASRLRLGAERPQARFIHLLATHTPWNRDRECGLVEPDNTSIRIALNNMRCAVEGVRTTFEALRAQGVYDSSTILVIADHGARGLPAGMDIVDSGRAALGLGPGHAIRHETGQGFRMPAPGLVADDPFNDPRPLAANPLFMAKPPGARGGLRIEDRRAVSLLDVPATICAHTALCGADEGEGVNAFGAPPAQERPRPFLSYQLAAVSSRWLEETVEDIVTPVTLDYSMVLDRGEDAEAALAVQTGPVYEFSRPGVLPGFGLNERWGRWSSQTSAGFTLCPGELSAPVEAFLQGRVYLAESSPRQRIAITVNDRPVFSRAYQHEERTDREPQSWRFDIRPGDLDERGCARIGFDLPDAAPPPATWREADVRRLAIGLETLRLAR